MQAIASGIYYESNYPGVTLGAVIMPRGTLMIDAPLRPEDARTFQWQVDHAADGAFHRTTVHGQLGVTGFRVIQASRPCVTQQIIPFTFPTLTSFILTEPLDFGLEGFTSPRHKRRRWRVAQRFRTVGFQLVFKATHAWMCSTT